MNWGHDDPRPQPPQSEPQSRAPSQIKNARGLAPRAFESLPLRFAARLALPNQQPEEHRQSGKYQRRRLWHGSATQTTAAARAGITEVGLPHGIAGRLIRGATVVRQ